MLLQALGKADALLSFHTKGFDASEWCGQEIGFALGRGIPVVPIMVDVPPGGFVGALQAGKWKADDAKAVAGTIFNTLAQYQEAAKQLGDALSRELKFAGSWDRAFFLVQCLNACGPLSDDAMRSVRLAQAVNDQAVGSIEGSGLLAP